MSRAESLSWMDDGLCQLDPDRMFVKGAAQQDAKKICQGCPVRIECLAWAFGTETEWGVYGGMTERERRAVLREFGFSETEMWKWRVIAKWLIQRQNLIEQIKRIKYYEHLRQMNARKAEERKKVAA